MGRVALGVTSQGSHRSGRAQLTHPARLVAVSRALCYPWSFRGQWIGVQCPRTVARARFRDKAPPSLHRLLAARVPRLLWYYGVLRFPYALPAALRFLRATVTSPCACVRHSNQVRRRPGAGSFRVWQPPAKPVIKEMATYGRPKFLGNPCAPMPCSLTPAGPRQQATTLLRHGPRSQHDEGYPRVGNFGAQSHGLGTRCLRFVRAITGQDARLAAGCWPSSTRRDLHPQGSIERFR
jgi:hypothetical protein